MKPSLAAERYERLEDGWYEDGWYPIHVAVVTQKQELVDLLIPHLKRESISVRNSGDCSCHWQTFFNASNIATRRVRSGSTALHYACLLGNMPIVETLINAGADWKIKDNHEWSASS